MRRILIYSLFSLGIFVAPAFAQQLAFPTAEGFGRFSTGGRGGHVCHVNTLSTAQTGSQIGAGPHHQGSFRYCFYQPGPVTIVFDIAGVYDDTFTSGSGNPALPDRTYAGQTAPGDGFVLKGTQLQYKSNTIIRYIVSRNVDPNPGPSSWGGIEGFSNEASNSIIDHCSMSYATDDHFSFPGSSDITYQWNIINDGLCCHSYSKGGLLGGSGSTRGSLLYNLIANNSQRTPWVQIGDHQIINNVVYNPSTDSYLSDGFGQIRIDLYGNYLKHGPDSTSTDAAYYKHSTFFTDTPGSSLYIEGNFHTTLRPNDTFPESAVYFNRSPTSQYPIVSTPFFTVPPSQMSASDAYTQVLARAGARVPMFTAIDQQVIDDVINLTGQVHANNPTYPTISVVSRSGSYDTDSDGIPDAWETLCSSSLGGLDPNDGGSNDGADIISGIDPAVDGYSKLEVFLNELAGDYEVNSCGGLLSAGGLAFLGAPSSPSLAASTLVFLGNPSNPSVSGGVPASLGDPSSPGVSGSAPSFLGNPTSPGAN